MIDYGKQRSTVEPAEIELTETKVFVASDITAVQEQGTDGQEDFTGYEFGLIEYDKNEYIRLQAEKSTELEEELTQTQVALAEVYEMMA